MAVNLTKPYLTIFASPALTLPYPSPVGGQSYTLPLTFFKLAARCFLLKNSPKFGENKIGTAKVQLYKKAVFFPLLFHWSLKENTPIRLKEVKLTLVNYLHEKCYLSLGNLIYIWREKASFFPSFNLGNLNKNN